MCDRYVRHNGESVVAAWLVQSGVPEMCSTGITETKSQTVTVNIGWNQPWVRRRLQEGSETSLAAAAHT